jgi:hypothetical protein
MDLLTLQFHGQFRLIITIRNKGFFWTTSGAYFKANGQYVQLPLFWLQPSSVEQA